MNKYQKLILNMLELQDKLNCATNGDDWKNGFTKTGEEINWGRCIFNEVSEFQNSFQWKHWKDTSKIKQYQCIDLNNAQIELVDIWHFIMSLILEKGLNEEIIYENIITEMHNKDIDLNILETSELLVNCAILLNINKALDKDEDNNKILINTILRSFFELLEKMNLLFEELYKLYILKNVLNQFRQDHGYKDGSYIKMWNGVEDNEKARQILDKNPNINPEELYIELEKEYMKLEN